MAKTSVDKTQADVDPAPAPTDSGGRVAALEAQLAETRQLLDKATAQIGRVTTLLMREEGEMTPERKAAREWAMLSPEEKTKLVAAEKYKRGPSDGLFSVVLLGPEPEKKPTECFPLTLPARDKDEAEIRYRRVMGINRTEGVFDVKQVAAPAAA